ncbi:MAG: HEAT repeat domain-containing protein [Thermodesulfovibrionales bacterium]|nr:HEAT repeat domain-containing protein [Thermodesulfovibrionales bacterium]
MAKKLLKHIRDLSDSNEIKRRSAAEALSTGDERAIYPLIKALRDTNAGVQDAAMRSLIAIGGETTAYMVLPLLREDAFLRNTAMIILKEIGRETVPLLRNLLRDKDDDIRKFAIDLLIEINHCDYLDDLINILKYDKNANVRASAAKALGVFKYTKAIPDLIEALKDEEWVCFSALEALSQIKDESTVDVIAALLNSRSETLVYSAIEVLGKLGSPKAERYLTDYYPLADAIEREAILKSLIFIGSIPKLPGASDILIEIYTKGDWHERLLALRGLVALKETKAIKVILDVAGLLDPSHPEDLDTLISIKQILKGFNCTQSLIEVLLDEDTKYRAKTLAIEIIEDQHCHEAVPYLVRLYEENLRDVKRASIKALGEIGNKNTEAILLDACDDQDGHVRRSAISAIGRLGDKSAVAKLLKLLDEEIYMDVKEEIIKSILTIDSKTLYQRIESFNSQIKELITRYANDVDVLLKLSSDSDLDVRLSAIYALGRINDEKAIEKLKDYLHDENKDVRKTALMSIKEKNCCEDDIFSMLDDEDLWIKIYAIKALSSSSDIRVVEKVKEFLNSGEIPLVFAAMDYIYQRAVSNRLNIRELFDSLLKHTVPSIKERAKEMVRSYEAIE